MDKFDYGAIMSLLFVAFMVGVWFGTSQMVKADILIKGLNDHNGVLSIVNGSNHAVVHGHKIVSILLPNANPDNGTQTDAQQPLTIQSQQHIPSAADSSLSVSVPTQCQVNGTALPDSQCTPGDTNSDVTENTLGSTICVHGWTATIRPPVSFTDPLKLQLMQSYGFG